MQQIKSPKEKVRKSEHETRARRPSVPSLPTRTKKKGVEATEGAEKREAKA